MFTFLPQCKCVYAYIPPIPAMRALSCPPVGLHVCHPSVGLSVCLFVRLRCTVPVAHIVCGICAVLWGEISTNNKMKSHVLEMFNWHFQFETLLLVWKPNPGLEPWFATLIGNRSHVFKPYFVNEHPILGLKAEREILHTSLKPEFQSLTLPWNHSLKVIWLLENLNLVWNLNPVLKLNPLFEKWALA